MFSERIANGQNEVVLIVGGEAIDLTTKRLKQTKRQGAVQLLAEWRDDKHTSEPTMVAASYGARYFNDAEVTHGLMQPVIIYPMFEQALRSKLGHSIPQHQQYMGELCHGMSRAAARPENAKHAWFPEVKSASEIRTPGPSNRFVG
jgi:acetyl-CoA C-acetyltransferase